MNPDGTPDLGALPGWLQDETPDLATFWFYDPRFDQWHVGLGLEVFDEGRLIGSESVVEWMPKALKFDVGSTQAGAFGSVSLRLTSGFELGPSVALIYNFDPTDDDDPELAVGFGMFLMRF